MLPYDNPSAAPLESPLRDLASQLPILVAAPCIIGEPRLIDAVMTKAQFTALSEHMLNGYKQDEFLRAFRNRVTNELCFLRAKQQCAAKVTSWAWASITTSYEPKTAIGYYPGIRGKPSRWGAIDFDAHDGNVDRASRLAISAYQLLSNIAEQFGVYLILCSSGGGGFHVFLISRDFHPLRDWIDLLCAIARRLGTPVVSGICEIFPNERAESQTYPNPIRGPGTLNPKTGEYSLVLAETITRLLPSLRATWRSKPDRTLYTGSLSLTKRTSVFSDTTVLLIQELIEKYPVLQKRTRNDVLMKLIGDLSMKFGKQLALQVIERHYTTYNAFISTLLQDHLAQAEKAWTKQRERIVKNLGDAEKSIYQGFPSENQQDAFVIIYAFAALASERGEDDFPIGRDSLADRVSVQPQGAGYIIGELVAAGAIQKTREYQRNRACARYRWIAGTPKFFGSAK